MCQLVIGQSFVAFQALKGWSETELLDDLSNGFVFVNHKASGWSSLILMRTSNKQWTGFALRTWEFRVQVNRWRCWFSLSIIHRNRDILLFTRSFPSFRWRGFTFTELRGDVLLKVFSFGKTVNKIGVMLALHSWVGDIGQLLNYWSVAFEANALKFSVWRNQHSFVLLQIYMVWMLLSRCETTVWWQGHDWMMRTINREGRRCVALYNSCKSILDVS